LGAFGGDNAVDEVDIGTAWEGLVAKPRAQLVDVRTRAEWTYVGIPDLGPLGKRAVLVEWQTFPDQAVDARFAERLAGSRRSASNLRTTSSSFAVREAGAWLRLRRWRRRGTAVVTTSRAVSKDRSTTRDIAAPSQVGRRQDSPGNKARERASP
jgi:hypothetical protein